MCPLNDRFRKCILIISEKPYLPKIPHLTLRLKCYCILRLWFWSVMSLTTHRRNIGRHIKRQLSNLCILAGSVSTLNVSPGPSPFRSPLAGWQSLFMRASVSKHNHCWAAPLLDDRGKEAIHMHLKSLLIDDYRFNFPHRMHLEHLNLVWNCQRVPKFEFGTSKLI